MLFILAPIYDLSDCLLCPGQPSPPEEASPFTDAICRCRSSHSLSAKEVGRFWIQGKKYLFPWVCSAYCYLPSAPWVTPQKV
jgi:hypothetical protein